MADDPIFPAGKKSYMPVEEPEEEEEPTNEAHSELPDPVEGRSEDAEVKRALKDALAKARHAREKAALGQIVEDSPEEKETSLDGDR